MIKEVVHRVEEIGQMENTVFIMTSDNGYNHGAHRLIHKMAPYPESVRVPFAVRAPSHFLQQGEPPLSSSPVSLEKSEDLSLSSLQAEESQEGSMETRLSAAVSENLPSKQRSSSAVTIRSPVKLIDLLPTFLDMAGYQKPTYVDGKSWKPLLSQQQSALEEEARQTGPSVSREVFVQYGGGAAREALGGGHEGIASEIPAFLFSLGPWWLSLDVPPHRALYSEDGLLYVEWMGETSNARAPHGHELYNVTADPHTLDNLLHSRPKDADVKNAKQRLDARLQELKSCKGDECP
uniref:Sulfatase N-terminal domain-containing protein n=1 Tax=Chromera velia CCMP2878 TaxID=1169474 RepID=A0A0G4HFH8_9ALVE|eukprot:Cvel_27052.t1-p1 / transcript=Cvel_27052.t1 / gene=Cvel_27052 / organism=Chromera_velia_CCMP2878 / gene_product=hypothetical protein / transcript_product=hypothetical protein / location=Cvel_scaffold3311:15593-18055(-) / protein_length=292 / sequence_SO=supercontig / SO=protein_coding / is_pseudo=false